jgi:hypothetical protein
MPPRATGGRLTDHVQTPPGPSTTWPTLQPRSSLTSRTQAVPGVADPFGCTFKMESLQTPRAAGRLPRTRTTPQAAGRDGPGQPRLAPPAACISSTGARGPRGRDHSSRAIDWNPTRTTPQDAASQIPASVDWEHRAELTCHPSSPTCFRIPGRP